jgi:flagellar biosynthetic protein FlhB
MAGQEGSQEKTEKPTPKRLREARKKGQVFHSKDMESVVVLTAIFAAIAFSLSFFSHEIQSLMKGAFQVAANPNLTREDMYHLGTQAFWTAVKVSAPVLITGVLVAALAGFLQTGAVFSLEPLKPQLKKLDMIENLKNMAKPKTFFELFKNIIKIFVIFLIAYTVLKGMLEPFLMTVGAPIEGSARLGGMVIVRFMIRFLIIFLMVAIMDLFMQRHEYMKNLKMSKEEVKREYKEDEGDPLIKGQRRQIHMEMAMGDVKQKMKTADAVITNPTHLAIAIKYDKKEMIAPQVVAKGQRLYAEYIKELAKEYDVPVIRNVPLAWSLIELEIDDEIPEKLYIAVAEILTFVYKMKEERKSQGGKGS